jgi:hypothetical protein
MKRALCFSFVALICTAGIPARADYIEPSFFNGRLDSPPRSAKSENIISEIGLRGAIGLSLGSGTASNQSGSIASRALNSAAIESHLGFKSKYFEPFAYGVYEYAQQATAASVVSNTNLTGFGYLAGGGVAIDLAPFSLSATYLFLGQYAVSQSTSSGQALSYTQPTGYRFAIDYEIVSSLLLTASYRVSNFSSVTQSGSKADISNDKFTRTTAGLSLSWGF